MSNPQISKLDKVQKWELNGNIEAFSTPKKQTRHMSERI